MGFKKFKGEINKKIILFHFKKSVPRFFSTDRHFNEIFKDSSCTPVSTMDNILMARVLLLEYCPFSLDFTHIEKL